MLTHRRRPRGSRPAAAAGHPGCQSNLRSRCSRLRPFRFAQRGEGGGAAFRLLTSSSSDPDQLLEEDAARQEAQAEIGRQLAIKKNWPAQLCMATSLAFLTGRRGSQVAAQGP